MNVRRDVDDRTLVERVIHKRDDRAFSALYDRHAPRMYRMALAQCGGDATLAEDVVHDAWIAAVNRLRDFKWESQLLTWLLGFVLNTARAKMRATAKPMLSDIELPVDDRALEGTFDRIDLVRAISKLAHGYREVFVLHDIEGFNHDEIAAMLGITAGGSKSQLSRARATLRRLLSNPDQSHA